ncbi:hypothetical protein HOA92_06750 [archaeon]|jgi:hypothetical protein|nr:hypothetical protein [archaeon]MBT6762711.1 hypothetical protein [archaeon]
MVETEPEFAATTGSKQELELKRRMPKNLEYKISGIIEVFKDRYCTSNNKSFSVEQKPLNDEIKEGLDEILKKLGYQVATEHHIHDIEYNRTHLDGLTHDTFKIHSEGLEYFSFETQKRKNPKQWIAGTLSDSYILASSDIRNKYIRLCASIGMITTSASVLPFGPSIANLIFSNPSTTTSSSVTVAVVTLTGLAGALIGYAIGQNKHPSHTEGQIYFYNNDVTTIKKNVMRHTRWKHNRHNGITVSKGPDYKRLEAALKPIEYFEFS